jgi:hypothetical protein
VTSEQEPLFLSVAEVVALHDDQLRLYGGSAGIRDAGALESAVATPAATFDPDMRLYDAMIALSSRTLDKQGLARLFRELAVSNLGAEEE